MDIYNKYYEGVFWIPSNEENKIIGTLHIDDNGISTISSLQSLCIENGDTISNRFPKFDVVYGLINKNENSETFSVKLYETRQNHQGIGYLNKFKYVSQNSFISKGGDDKINVEKYNCLLLNSVQIDQWINITGFKVDTNLNDKFEVNQVYKIPDPIIFFKNSDFKIYVHFRSSSTSTSFLNRKSIVKEDIFINIETTKRYNIKEIVKIKNEIEWLFNLLLYQSFRFENIEIKSISQTEYKLISKPKELINQLKRGVEFDLVQQNSHEIFNKWFTKKPILELYLINFFSVYSQKGVLVENRFLTYVSIIESYQRENFQNDDNKSILKKYKIPDKDINKHKDLILHHRLLIVFNKSSMFSSKEGLKKLTEKIKDTRNFHIHLNGSKKEKSLKWEEIIKVNNLLEILIIEVFLREIGIKGKTFRLIKLSDVLKKTK